MNNWMKKRTNKRTNWRSMNEWMNKLNKHLKLDDLQPYICCFINHYHFSIQYAGMYRTKITSKPTLGNCILNGLASIIDPYYKIKVLVATFSAATVAMKKNYKFHCQKNNNANDSWIKFIFSLPYIMQKCQISASD